MNTSFAKNSAVSFRKSAALAIMMGGLLIPEIASARDESPGWSLNFTPVLVPPRGHYDLGGGADPEFKFSSDRGGVRLSGGLRVGAYYANNLFGIMAMPTIRLSAPMGAVEPYASFGMGQGWIPSEKQDGLATMSRFGIVFHISKRISLGLEVTFQKIDNTNFAFPSIGSPFSINLLSAPLG